MVTIMATVLVTLLATIPTNPTTLINPDSQDPKVPGVNCSWAVEAARLIAPGHSNAVHIV